MKHKLFFFTIMMMVCALTNKVNAYDFSKTNNGKTIYYRIISDSTVIVTYPGSSNSYHYWEYYQNYQWNYYPKPTGSIIIPPTVTNGNYQYTVTGIDAYAFIGCNDITSITLPNTIRTIGSYAFDLTGTESLNAVYYGGTLSEWCCVDFENLYANPLYYGNHLYINNELVTNLVIPEGVDSIKNYSFIHMYNEPTPYNRTSYLDTIILPNTLRYIGRYAFEWDYYEKHLVIPSSVDYIEELAFNYALYGGVTLSSSIDTIRYYTFQGCRLPTLIIPDGVRYIANGAFYNCLPQYIEIPASVTAMGESVFYIGNISTENAHHFRFKGRTPPNILPNTFDGVIRYKVTGEWPTHRDTMTIEVPCQSVETYREATYWDTISVFICSTQVCLFEITAESNNDSLGIIIGGGVYTTDDTCTLTAISKYNVSFAGWSDGIVDNPRIVSVSSDSVFMAMFSERDTTILTDTLINVVYDTTYITRIVHDTTIIIDTVTLTEYVPVHDTTILIDTVVLMQYDTITLTDTLWLTQYDTVWLHDTVVVHDTIYITQEGIDGVDALNAKVYSSNGQIVVEDAEGNAVTMYDVNGRMLATRQDDYMPMRFDVPVSGTYMIKVGTLPAKKVVVIR